MLEERERPALVLLGEDGDSESASAASSGLRSSRIGHALLELLDPFRLGHEAGLAEGIEDLAPLALVSFGQ